MNNTDSTLDRPVCADPVPCCRELSRVWTALGITGYTGKSASEEVRSLVEDVKRLRNENGLIRRSLDVLAKKLARTP